MRKIIKQVLKEEIDSRTERIKSIVNKFGIDQSLEMIVGGTETIKQAFQDNPLEFLNQFNDLTPVETGDRIYYVDKDRLPLFFYYSDEKDEYVYINNVRIWKFFSKVFGLEYNDIKVIVKKWLEETYNLKGLIPAAYPQIRDIKVG